MVIEVDLATEKGKDKPGDYREVKLLFVRGVPAELALLRVGVRPDFEMVLLGKDGGVKARASDPVALEEFLALIDTMPMRRRGSDDVACDRE